MRSYSPTVTPAGTSIWISTFAVAMGSSVNQEIGCFQLHPTLCRHRLAAKGQNAQRCTYQRESQHNHYLFPGPRNECSDTRWAGLIELIDAKGRKLLGPVAINPNSGP